MTAIVTGGTRGIGFAIAKEIVADGGRVMINGLDPKRLERAVTALAGGANATRVAGMVADVRDRTAVERLVNGTLDRFGRIDALVNNAGVGAFAPVASMSDADWHRVIDTNLTGVFYSSRAVIPALKQAGGGWIVSIASLAGRNYFPEGAAYCASKAALVAFSEALMQEVRFDDIRVTVILPGSVATDFTGPSGDEARSRDDSWKLTPDDVAQAVMDVLRHPRRSLPSKIEIRPAKTIR